MTDSETLNLVRQALLGSMIPSVAHEMSTPLSVLMGNVDLVNAFLGDEEPDMPRIRKAMNRLPDAGNRLKDLLDALRETALAGRPELKEPVSALTVLDRCRDLCATDLRHANVTLDVEAADRKCAILVPKGRALIAVLVLVRRAVLAATGKGGEKDKETKIRVRVGAATNQKVSFSIDRGGPKLQGADPKELELCQALLAEMGGSLEAQSDGWLLQLPSP